MKTGSFKLCCLGVLGLAFFVLTDARLGYGMAVDGRSNTNLNDAIHAFWPGTVIGLVGSGMVLLIGLWLSTRKAI